MFSPVRPAPSGISDYTEELLPHLAEDLDIDLFIDNYQPTDKRLAEIVKCRYAESFRDIHAREPYSLAVYHMGNSPYHDYIYPHLYGVPGLTVLHDLSLHSTRLRSALESWTGEHYRDEMVAAYGDRGWTAAEIALAGLHNQLMLRIFPLAELAVRASIMTVVHDAWVAEQIRATVPSAEVRAVPMGIEQRTVGKKEAQAVRERYSIANESFVIGTFGLLTPEKRIPQLLKAFRWLLGRRPDTRCLLAGACGEDLPLDELVQGLEISDKVIITGRLTMDDFLAHMAACDVTAFLRWPTQRETSAVLLRAMAMGRPALVSDLAHLHALPDSAVLKVPIVDEGRNLRRALLELAENEPRRRRLGEAAASHFLENNSWERVRKRWLGIIAEAVDLAADFEMDKSFLPQHLQ